MRIIIFITFLLMLSPYCYAQNNNTNDDDFRSMVKDALQKKEMSEIMWNVEMSDEIEREYGSSESSYYNNRGNSSTYSDDVGGDAFNSFGY